MEDNDDRTKSVYSEENSIKEIKPSEQVQKPSENEVETALEEEEVVVVPKKQMRKRNPRSSLTPRPRTDKYTTLVEKETKRLIMLQPTAGQAVRFELVLGPTFFNLKCLPKAPVFTQREADRLDRLLTDDSGGLFPPKQM